MTLSPIEMMQQAASTWWPSAHSTTVESPAISIPITTEVGSDALVTALPTPMHIATPGLFGNPGVPDKITSHRLLDPFFEKPKTPRLIPLLDPPKEHEVIYDLDAFVTYIFGQMLGEHKELLKAKHSIIDLERAIKNEFQTRSQEEAESVANAARQERLWKLFEKIASTAAFVVTALVYGSTGWGSIPIAIGAILTIDQLCDDYLKHLVAHFIAQGDKESEAAWLQRLQIFAGIVLVGCSLGIAAPQLVRAAVSISQATFQCARGISEYRHNLTRAMLTELTEAVKSSKYVLDILIESAQRMVTTIHDLYENMLHIDRSRRRLLSSMRAGFTL